MARSRELSALINTVAADGITGKLSVDPNTGQAYGVVESQVGTDYNSTLYKGYFCRAWVNFNGVGTVAIRASGNVSSITDNGTGNFGVNFTTAMPDTSYSVTVTNQDVAAGTQIYKILGSTASSGTFEYTTSAVRIGAAYDSIIACVSVFR